MTALDGLDLRVERGAFFGLLGPNGAGKSTTVGVCTTLVRPSSGRAFLLGHDVVADAAVARAAVGLVFQEPSIDPELTPWETLELTARLHHLAEPRRRAADLVDAVGLSGEVGLQGALAVAVRRTGVAQEEGFTRGARRVQSVLRLAPRPPARLEIRRIRRAARGYLSNIVFCNV